MNVTIERAVYRLDDEQAVVELVRRKVHAHDIVSRVRLRDRVLRRLVRWRGDSGDRVRSGVRGRRAS